MPRSKRSKVGESSYSTISVRESLTETILTLRIVATDFLYQCIKKDLLKPMNYCSVFDKDESEGEIPKIKADRILARIC